jgi:uncharacterized protein (DUF433 family)
MITAISRILKTPDRCSGDACIRETRIAVWMLVNRRRVGASDAVILEAYPSLQPADLEEAWTYAVTNSAEIDRAIAENEEGGDRRTRTLDVLAAVQGITGPTQFDALFGAGAELWDNDEDFAAFLESLRESRRTAG